MSDASNKRSAEFLQISAQFKLGALVTESSHPVTANLSEGASRDIAEALDLLFQVDADVVAAYEKFVDSGRAGQIKDAVLAALKKSGRIFFTGCGSTGRLSILLDSVWRGYWQKARISTIENLEDRTFSVMAGGDFALIKSVEGFEDFAAFGKKQIGDLGVTARDIVFAITEGGETSFVIGTAWKGVEVGAKVYFVYNNPDDILCEHVARSREVIEDPRIEKLNLTTGPMAITGSTRMQATTIQLCAMLTVMEMVVRELAGGAAGEVAEIPRRFLAKFTELHAALRTPEVLAQLAQLVAFEETTYRSGHKNNYYADAFGIDVLTDTTERSPTYCTPPFRKFDDATATESWAFLFLPCAETASAWQSILKREPRCVEWTRDETRALVGDEKLPSTHEIIRKISRAELMRFRIGADGMTSRRLAAGDCAIAIVSGTEATEYFGARLAEAAKSGARTGVICFGTRSGTLPADMVSTLAVNIPIPATDFLLDGITRVGVKMVLNALSTCTMVRLGRVMGNYMIWVVASNLKLIDRATRYIQKLTGLAYDDANRLLFEVVEYVEPRMKADQAYPPVVGMAVWRARHQLTNEQAEAKLKNG